MDETLHGQTGEPHVNKPCSSRGTSTTPISIEGTVQQGIGKPGGSWNALVTSWSWEGSVHLSKFANDIEMCSAVNTLEGRDAVQRDVVRLER